MQADPSQRTKRHLYPLTPIDPPPNADPSVDWYRCDRCGTTFSEPHPTELANRDDCSPQSGAEGDEWLLHGEDGRWAVQSGPEAPREGSRCTVKVTTLERAYGAEWELERERKQFKEFKEAAHARQRTFAERAQNAEDRAERVEIERDRYREQTDKVRRELDRGLEGLGQRIRAIFADPAT